MKKLTFCLSIISFAILSSLFSASVAAQTKEPRATKFEIKNSTDINLGGELHIIVSGKQRKIADQAIEAWLINGGKEVVYSASDGSGGFENEGQSLRIYDVKTGKTQKILSEYFMVDAVAGVKLSNGATALLVTMSDGGLGGSYFAVVDPKRGEVLFRQWAELAEIKGDSITLAFYNDDDWEKINEERGWTDFDTKRIIPKPTKVKPYKTEKLDLKAVLKNKVIYNKRDNFLANEENSKVKVVKIYLWRANDELPNRNFVLMAVSRQVNAAAPLRPTLEALFAGATEDEVKNEFSDSTFGMKFVGVALKNGTALVKFSQPPNETNYGSLGPFIFAEAIERTAKQFPTVKKVEICAVGETLIDAQLEKPFPRCPK